MHHHQNNCKNNSADPFANKISKYKEREIKEFLVSELNREEQLKQIAKSTEKFLKHQAETERLRQIKIEIVGK